MANIREGVLTPVEIAALRRFIETWYPEYINSFQLAALQNTGPLGPQTKTNSNPGKCQGCPKFPIAGLQNLEARCDRNCGRGHSKGDNGKTLHVGDYPGWGI